MEFLALVSLESKLIFEYKLSPAGPSRGRAVGDARWAQPAAEGSCAARTRV